MILASFSNIVSASNTYTTGFEDGTASQQYNNGWLRTQNITNLDATHYFYVTNTKSHSGNYSFQMRSATGFWNYTYNTANNMVMWECDIRVDVSTGGYAYIDFLNSSGATLIHLRFYTDTSPQAIRLYYQDYQGTLHNSPAFSDSTWYHLKINFNAKDNVDYYFNTWNDTDAPPRTVSDDWRITSIKFQMTNDYWYFDNHNITVTTTGDSTTTTTIEGYDITSPQCGITGYIPLIGYCSFQGNVHTQMMTDDYCYSDCIPSYYHYSQYLEFTHDFKLTGKIYYIDLYVAGMQYSLVSNARSDYGLYVNGIGEYIPSMWIDTGDGNYILRWNFPYGIQLDNATPVFEFRCNAYYDDTTYGRYYWFLAIMPHECGYTFRVHDSSSNYGDGEIDGVPFHGCDFGIDNYIAPYIVYYYNRTYYGSGTPEEEIPDDKLDDYKDTYGNPNKNYSFIEFVDNNIGCKYVQGSHPTIMYYVTDDYLESQDYRSYLYEIVQTKYSMPVYQGEISIPPNRHNISGVFTVSDWSFQTTGQYIIRLYNHTAGIKGSLVIQSLPIYVCEGETGTQEGNPVFPTISQPLGSIIGMIITLFCLLSPFILAKGLHVRQQLHPIIYGVSGGLGIGISVVLGLFPSWLPFFLVAVGIIATVLAYLLNKRGGGD